MQRVAPSVGDRRRSQIPVALGRSVLLLLALYGFFLGLEMMGLSVKLFGKDVARQLIAATSNPFTGLVIGLLATTLVQSSSATTSMTVGLVAAGGITLEGAIPIIMGANIGTSVTNLIVAMGHITRREEFRRAFSGATVHDVFNLMTVAMLFPLEVATGVLARCATVLERWLAGLGGLELLDPVALVIEPVAQRLASLVGGSAAWTLALGLTLLFVALQLLVRVLKAIFTSRAQQVLHRTLLRSAPAAIVAGAAITVMVQSSSITTSLIVPLLGAGVVTLEQAFPLTLGANIGTTVTALLAALATGQPSALAAALSHLLFNAVGTSVIYPLRPIRAVPLAVARFLGDVGARNRALAVAYVVSVFYGLPLLVLLLSGVF